MARVRGVMARSRASKSTVQSGGRVREGLVEKFRFQLAVADNAAPGLAADGDPWAGDGLSTDERANRVLRAHGYPTNHSAAQVEIDHLSADMVVALARNHVALLEQLGADADRIRMLRSFDPRSGAYVLDVDDPYYGDHDDFEAVLDAIEASLPGLHKWIDERLARDGSG